MPDTQTLDAGIGHNSRAVAEILHDEPGALFDSPTMLDDLIKELEAEIEATPVNLETAKGRKALTTLATRITKFKTSLDGEGKHRNEAARESIGKIDAVRRQVRTSLDDLKAKARQPLTEWEEAEAARQKAIADTRQQIMKLGETTALDTADKLQARIDELKAIEINRDLFGDLADDATGLLNGTISQLGTVLVRQKQHEADQAELARLRTEREKELAERETKAKAEADAKAEKERQQRIEDEKKAAAEKAAANAAAEAKRQAEEEAQAKLDAERKRAEEAEAELERQRAEEERQAEEAAARKADEEHRSKVMRKAETALLERINISAETATLIVLAIAAGDVPGLEVQF